MNRKKPTGTTWIEFARIWAIANHETKLKQAALYGVSYDTAKHWILEGDTTPPINLVQPPTTPETPEPDIDVVSEILSIPARTQLDFVSLDIETSSLKADFSVLLTAVVKPFGQKPICFRSDNYPTWTTHREDDRQIVADISREVSRHAVVITHYGRKFDVPYLRAKLTRYGLPNLPPMFGIDTWRIAKDNFCVGSRRLDALSSYFQLGSKSGVEGNLWMTAAYSGDKEAMDKIMAHNVQDCEILERLASMSFSYLKSMPRL